MTIKSEDFRLASSDGIHQLRIRATFPEEKPRAIVQIVHGISEHMERYDHFAEYLAKHGYLVIGDDHLGHGKSVQHPRELGFAAKENGWSFMVKDEEKVLSWVQKHYPDLPVVLFGHSMGSFLARDLAATHSDRITGLILSGTGQQPVWLAQLGKRVIRTLRLVRKPHHSSVLVDKLVFGSYTRKIDQPRTASDWLSTDPEEVDRFVRDPLCSDSSIALIEDLLTGVSRVCRPGHAENWRKDLPVLLVSGLEDPVGEYGKGVRKARQDFANSGIIHLSLRLYPDMRHEILNEKQKEQVMEDLKSWIEEWIDRNDVNGQ